MPKEELLVQATLPNFVLPPQHPLDVHDIRTNLELPTQYVITLPPNTGIYSGMYETPRILIRQTTQELSVLSLYRSRTKDRHHREWTSHRIQMPEEEGAEMPPEQWEQFKDTFYVIKKPDGTFLKG